MSHRLFALETWTSVSQGKQIFTETFQNDCVNLAVLITGTEAKKDRMEGRKEERMVRKENER